MITPQHIFGGASLLAALVCSAPSVAESTGPAPGLAPAPTDPAPATCTDDPEPERDWPSRLLRDLEWAAPADGQPAAHDSGTLAPVRTVAARLPAPPSHASPARAPPFARP
jgi:hypothetical protein